MKLKLEAQDEITVLVVTETINKGESAILRAGLQKLSQSGKKKILLDLGAVTQADSEEVKQIIQLPIHFSGSDTDVALCGSLPELGSPTKREEIIQFMKSPLGNMMATESLLKKKIESLEKMKAELTGKISQAGGDDLNGLKKTNSELRKLIRLHDSRMAELMKTRQAAAPKDARTEAVFQTISNILQQQGISK